MIMSDRIAVACQYTNGTKRCGNRTMNPTGLCSQHKNKVPLKDIHEGTGKKPLMTAIPRVGPVVASNASYTMNQPASNEEMAEKLLENKKKSFKEFIVQIFAPTPKPDWSRSRSGYRSQQSSGSNDSSSSATAADTSMATDIATGIF